MDIGTGRKLKIQNSNSKFRERHKNWLLFNFGVRTWLYDVVAPDYRFNAADYYQVALPVIKIFGGTINCRSWWGTGFILRPCLRMPTLGVPPDWSLRKNWKEPVEDLQRKLKIAPFRWQKMNPDRANPRRLIRALEVAAFGKKKEKTREFLGVKSFVLKKRQF